MLLHRTRRAKLVLLRRLHLTPARQLVTTHRRRSEARCLRLSTTQMCLWLHRRLHRATRSELPQVSRTTVTSHSGQ